MCDFGRFHLDLAPKSWVKLTQDIRLRTIEALMPGNQTKAYAATLVIAGSLASLLFTLSGGSPNFNPLPHDATGQVLAEETARLASGGGRITLITLDTTVYRSQATEAVGKAGEWGWTHHLDHPRHHRLSQPGHRSRA
jgi:hypothetical protein